MADTDKEHDLLIGDEDNWKIYETKTLQGFDWKSPLFTFLNVIGGSLQAIVLTLWISTFIVGGGPYFILLFSSLVFFVGFLILAIAWKLMYKEILVPSLKQYFLQFFLIGFFDALNGVLIVYASDPTRTPPVLQAILPNTSILWGILTTKLIVGKKNNPLQFCQAWPMISLFVVLAGIFLSLLPTIIGTIKGTIPFFHGEGGLIWSFMFALGIVPGALLNVIQEKFLKMRKREFGKEEQRSRSFDMIMLLMYSCLFQFLTLICFFWVDIIPGYGYSKNIDQFFENQWLSIKCFFNVYNGCSQCGWHGFLFIFGYFISYFSGAALNETSANYGLIAGVITTPFCAFFWVIFKNLNPQSSKTPLWSVLPSLVLLVAGSIFWRLWENHEKRKNLNKKANNVN